MGQSGWSDSGRSVFVGPPPEGGSRSTCGSWPEAWSSGSGGRDGAAGGGSARWDGFQRGRAEFAQHVVGAARELARDRQRRARVTEPAGLQREVVGVVRAAGPARRQRGLIERPAQLRGALASELADPGAAV